MVPKVLRDRVGLRPGEVEVTVEGSSLRIEPIATGRLVEVEGRLVVASSGTPVDDDLVRALRDAEQR